MGGSPFFKLIAVLYTGLLRNSKLTSILFQGLARQRQVPVGLNCLLFTPFKTKIKPNLSSKSSIVMSQTFPIRPRVNLPYLGSDVLPGVLTTTGNQAAPFPDITVTPPAILWFGTLNATSAYCEVRLAYNNTDLFIHCLVADRLLYYSGQPQKQTLQDWDAVTICLDINGNPAQISPSSFAFVGQLGPDSIHPNENWVANRSDFQAAWQGNIAEQWQLVEQPFETHSYYRGEGGPNSGNTCHGWWLSFRVPFSSLGLPNCPAVETIWGLGVLLHNRTQPAQVPAQQAVQTSSWPATFQYGNQPTPPSTWGELYFFDPSSSAASQPHGVPKTLQINPDLDGAVGGGTDCGEKDWQNLFDAWGNRNRAGVGQINIQSQTEATDWPCFAKYYLRIPLNALPAEAQIHSATLRLYQFGNSGEGTWGAAPHSHIQVFSVRRDWDPQTITWNNAPSAWESVASSHVAPVPLAPSPFGGALIPYADPPLAREWDVTRAVMQAVAADEPCRLLLYSADDRYHTGKYFYSLAIGDARWRPTLQIQYSLPDIRAKRQPTETENRSKNSSQMPPVAADAWAMAGANLKRTSWVNSEVDGIGQRGLKPLWCRPIPGYISQKVQVITAYGHIYIASSQGLYALSAANGDVLWHYPTALPLGNAPTVADGVAYCPGLDGRVHAVDAETGELLWLSTAAQAGFQTNPLCVNGLILLGSRDGIFYAFNTTGQIAWWYDVGSPILYSAAFADGLLYFGANNGRAYCLRARDGQLVWQSDELPGAGFYSWWPVIHRDWVIFSGSNNHRPSPNGVGTAKLIDLDKTALYGGRTDGSRQALLGQSWQANGLKMDATPLRVYLEQNPSRRTVFVFNRHTGNPERPAPLAWAGTQSGNRYPPVVGADNWLYQQNNYRVPASQWDIAGGQVAGWDPAENALQLVLADWAAVDEPHAYAAGGKYLYWSQCSDRSIGQVNLFQPLRSMSQPDHTREVQFYDEGNELRAGVLKAVMQQHFPLVQTTQGSKRYYAYGAAHGSYGNHGDQNPPIPYQGKLFLHRANCVIAFAPHVNSTQVLPEASERSVLTTTFQARGTAAVKQQLQQQVAALLQAGPMQPGYANHGLFGIYAQKGLGDDLIDYFQHPAATIIALLRARPHLTPIQQSALDVYVQREFEQLPPYKINHRGWGGTQRAAGKLPPEVLAQLQEPHNHSPRLENWEFGEPGKDADLLDPALSGSKGGWRLMGGWKRNPLGLYATWLYAQQYGGAATLWQTVQNWLPTVDWTRQQELFVATPFILNAYCAGYYGFIKLAQLAQQKSSLLETAALTLQRLLDLRVQFIASDSFYASVDESKRDFNNAPLDLTGEYAYGNTLNPSSDFIFLVPEVAAYIRTKVPLTKLMRAIAERERLAPLWFVTFAQEGLQENVVVTLYDSYGLFIAKALLQQLSAAELEQYLDIPAFPVGDLYQIEKLALTLSASHA